ncbi:histone-fold-containing protein [Acaromyces ingoldii]|uniref:Histone-fold-containing protein n=1 Tax=Acaromyces ingoldii TaxID=215250 RepID=A0A316YGK5_9BASI|nr:histone-fold-containing protein [Acaromyces ingoldii]PWN88660.1 histone-fold-containing protein [Acaromyces ingoldii]
MRTRDTTPPLVNATQTLESYSQDFWQRQMSNVEEHASSSTHSNPMDVFKPQAGQLPLARIKKVMKNSDDEVKMISAEAPILFARACEIFIADLTCRSYLHASANRRRTIQRSDVVAAVGLSNIFDFLVDIVPRPGANATSSSHGRKESTEQQQQPMRLEDE